jgi:Uma2 family endonuclease
MAEAVTLILADRKQFSLHPKDDMTESLYHGVQAVYFVEAFGQALPDLFAARNLAVYWVPGHRKHPYAGPDVLVSRFHPRQADPTVYLTYEDGPLTLVVEIASEKTRAKEKKKRDETYAQGLQVPEYLFVDFERHILELHELVAGMYEPVRPDSEGRLWSRELGVGFVWQEDGRLVRVLRPDGTVIPTRTEMEALLASVEERVEAERQRAEALAAELERLRRAMGGEG